jgi:type VI secretion system protein ImpA
VLRDLYDCTIGTSREVGLVRVRDIAIAHNKLAASSGDPGYSAGQIEGALQDIHAAEPALLEATMGTAAMVQKLQSIIEEKTGRADTVDLKPLRSITHLLRQVCQTATGTASETDGQGADDGTAQGTGGTGGAIRGEISSRQDALLMLDKVISYLERTEPGNPAPLLIKRAKRLVGVSFMDIMADLAPDAVTSIQIVTGRPPDA